MENEKNILIVTPKQTPIVGFVFTGFEKMGELVKFVGKKAVVTESGAISFGKHVVKVGDVVLRSSSTTEGIQAVQSLAFVQANYDVKEARVMNETDQVAPIEKNKGNKKEKK